MSEALLHNDARKLNIPDGVRLFCSSEECNRHTNFSYAPGKDYDVKDNFQALITLQCRNCQETIACFALNISCKKGELSGAVVKFGETPSINEPLPKKVLSLVGSEREYFFNGLKSERLGLGIAAFAYYRRVIEHKKTKIIEEIIKAAKEIDADQQIIEELEQAKAEKQFSNVIKYINTAIPERLSIQGHNPLKLLYSALSEGLHNENDEECLQLAKSIRIVLIEFSNNISSILDSKHELTNAINILTKK